MTVRLDDLSFEDAEVDAVLRCWREAIEAAHNWTCQGRATISTGPGGFHLAVLTAPSSVSAVVATGGISAASGSTLGSGNATLRHRTGTALVDGPVVRVLSHFSVAIPAGTRIEVCPDGEVYKLVGSDCVT